MEPGDDERPLHERIKTVERRLLVDAVGRMVREGWTHRPYRTVLAAVTHRHTWRTH